MKQSRRKFTANFKAKVAIEAVQERQTLAALAKKHSLHPNQIAHWKRDFVASAATVFERGKKHEDIDQQTNKLYEQIGQLHVELNFLKKKLNLK